MKSFVMSYSFVGNPSTRWQRIIQSFSVEQAAEDLLQELWWDCISPEEITAVNCIGVIR